MYFSKISLSKDLESLEKLKAYQKKNAYYYHQLIWDLFSENNPDKKRDFLYRAETIHHWPYFYAVSATEPCDKLNIWDIQSKEYKPSISGGEKLSFRLRANPRICRKNSAGKKQYFDIVQDAWHKNIDELKSGTISKNEIMQAAGERWLHKKANQLGFSVDAMIVENFRKERFNKKQQAVSFSLLDFSGKLTVLDETLFLTALSQGVGSAKGFGCGLLMVKR